MQISAIASLCREIPNLPAHPPAGFAYPLDGFIPPKPGRFCFIPAAPGIRPSELSPPATVPGAFPPERTHVPVVRPVHNAAQGSEAGPDDRGFWASTRAGVPCGRHVISTTTAGCSLGLFPFQGLRATRFAERPRRPLTCLSQFGKPNRTAPQSFASRHLVRSRAVLKAWLGRTAFLGFPHLCDPRHSRVDFTGLCVHLAPCRPLPFVRGALRRNPTLY
jgi:hypothetical protein